VRARVPEGQHWPIIVITSNSERPLPEPFLRRCVFHHIELTPDEIRNIVQRRLRIDKNEDVLIEQALRFVDKLRADDVGILKKPGTAEILAWLRLITDPERYRTSEDLPLSMGSIHASILEISLGVLLKSTNDLERGREILHSEPWWKHAV